MRICARARAARVIGGACFCSAQFRSLELPQFPIVRAPTVTVTIPPTIQSVVYKYKRFSEPSPKDPGPSEPPCEKTTHWQTNPSRPSRSCPIHDRSTRLGPEPLGLRSERLRASLHPTRYFWSFWAFSGPFGTIGTSTMSRGPPCHVQSHEHSLIV